MLVTWQHHLLSGMRRLLQDMRLRLCLQNDGTFH